jgi:hypothetical protein
LGQSICWVVLLNGERRGTAYSSRYEAEECKAAWLAQLRAETAGSRHCA